jgi:hypothetical protein
MSGLEYDQQMVLKNGYRVKKKSLTRAELKGGIRTVGRGFCEEKFGYESA